MCNFRRLKIKKLIFLAASVLFASILLTCSNPHTFQASDVSTVSRSPYVGDSYSVTVYLDGKPPSLNSRSLTKDNAISGHDLFEVVFLHPATGTIARASWEKGHAAVINGVFRNVDYRYVSESAALTNAGLAANPGAALLFVGKRSDKTLLAVGKLIEVDGQPGTFISGDSKSVTFEVNALKAGTSPDAESSSFLTAAADPGGNTNSLANAIDDNTDIVVAKIGAWLFPLYRMPLNKIIRAKYIIEVSSNNFNSFYCPGILLAGPASLREKNSDYHLPPLYPIGGGGAQGSTILTPDTETGLTLDNNQTTGNPLNNTVEFTFNTSTTEDGSIFAFAFEIPVYPLSASGRGPNEEWFIRPGYDSYLEYLDDGKGGTGGAVLIGSGNVDQSFTYNLWVKAPNKTRYYDDEDPLTLNDFIFDLTGIIIYLRVGTSPVENINPGNPNLEYWLGGTGGVQVNPNDPIGTILTTNPVLSLIDNSMLTVLVVYHDTGTSLTYSDAFVIYLTAPDPSGQFDLDSIPAGNRFVITNQSNMLALQTALANTSSGGDTYIIVLYHSYDLGSIHLGGGGNGGVPYFIILIAAAPNLVIGRNPANSVFNSWGLNNTFYIGVWPFDDTLYIGGNAVVSYPFTINAAGSWRDVAVVEPPPTVASTYFFNWPSSTNAADRIANFNYGAGVVVANDDYLIDETP